MTDSGRRYCPRCGTARVGEMPFCPNCGLNLTDSDESAVAEPVAEPLPLRGQLAEVETDAVDRPSSSDTRRPGLAIPPVVLVIAIVVVGLLVLGLLRLPQIGGSPPVAPQASAASSGAVAAPIVGLSILSPTDGQTVAVKDVLVIGLAPPGLGITQDVSLGLDQHTTADGTGHWAIKVGLSEGDNVLKFRIGDDHSTEKTVRVIYTPSGG